MNRAMETDVSQTADKTGVYQQAEKVKVEADAGSKRESVERRDCRRE